MNEKRKFLNKTKSMFYDEIKKYQNELIPTKEISGFGSMPIVGEKNYPNLNIHNISNSEISNSYLNSSNVVKKDYSEIVKLKAKNILGSTNKIYVKDVNDRINTELLDIYKSKKLVEFSSKFENELKFNKIVVDKIAGIGGSKNELISLKANENISTSKQIEKYSNEDIKSKEAIISLYEKGINEHQIINLLALGNFGIQINKKLVPTKWAISVYDQIIEKYLYQKITKFNCINNYEIYYYEDKGNFFLVILFPEVFSCEIIEQFDEILEQDYVSNNNKLNKSEPETAGGFWASKLAIQEYLYKRKKQASYISIRIIDGYDIPLGVVFVRESLRETMKKMIFKSSNLKEVEEFLKQNYFKHFIYFKKSKLLYNLNTQKKLNEFI